MCGFVGVGLGDVVAGAEQERGEGVGEGVYVSAASSLDFGVGAGEQYDRFQEGCVTAEEVGELCDRRCDEFAGVQVPPGRGFAEDLLVGDRARDAVLVDGEEQGVLVGGAVVQGPGSDLRFVVQGRDAERFVVAFLDEFHAGVQNAGPRRPGAFLAGFPDLQEVRAMAVSASPTATPACWVKRLVMRRARKQGSSEWSAYWQLSCERARVGWDDSFIRYG